MTFSVNTHGSGTLSLKTDGSGAVITNISAQTSDPSIVSITPGDLNHLTLTALKAGTATVVVSVVVTEADGTQHPLTSSAIGTVTDGPPPVSSGHATTLILTFTPA